VIDLNFSKINSLLNLLYRMIIVLTFENLYQRVRNAAVSSKKLLSESCHTCDSFMSLMRMSHVTHVNESCHSCECVMSRMWTCHVPHAIESCYSCEWVIGCMWMCAVTWMKYGWNMAFMCTHVIVSNEFHSFHSMKYGVHVYESCYSCECVMSRMWMHHCTHVIV